MSIPATGAAAVPGADTDSATGRLLMLCTTSRDAAMAAQVLARAGIQTEACADAGSVVQALQGGAGALLLAEEALAGPGAAALTMALAAQPPWSDLPVLLLARPGAASPVVDQAMQTLANVTVIERPVRVATLVSTVRAALRARARQLALRDVLQNLQQVDRRKTEFLATLAHELRNPLAPLTTTLALLARTRPTPDAAQPHYAVMTRQLDHMGRLINDLMEMSRVKQGKIALQPVLLPLQRVLRDAVELSQPLLDARRQVLVVDDGAPGLTVRGDSVRLAQVFANLLNNAAKYTPPGGHIHVGLRQHGGMASVTVRDNGSGIPDDKLDSIFDMFVQVNDTARAAQGGLGIGLTLVRSLVHLHGGQVRARSAGPGQGSEFEVLLPLVAAATLPTAAVPDASRPLLGTGRVLVVDDNRDAADSLAALLDLLGAETAVAYSGLQALALAARWRPDVAILDIGMPGMDGHELATRLRADPAHAGLVLMALSGWKAADMPGATAEGFDHHLLKPPDLQRLITLLEAVAASPRPVPGASSGVTS